MVRIFGTGNATITGCLSDDSGAHCISPAVDMAVLGASGGNPAATFPASCGSDLAQNCFPNNGFWGGWNFTPMTWQMEASRATVNVAGSAVTSVNGNFNLNWKTGGKVFIAGSAPICVNSLCTISSVNNSSSMTIVENPGTLNAAQFESATAGVVLWVKKTGGTSTASISVNFDYAYSDQFTMPLNGTVDQCSPNPTTVSYAADGVTPIAPVQGELCLASHPNGPKQALYLLIPSTGETRFLSPIYFHDGADQQVDQVRYLQMLGAGFDTLRIRNTRLRPVEYCRGACCYFEASITLLSINIRPILTLSIRTPISGYQHQDRTPLNTGIRVLNGPIRE